MKTLKDWTELCETVNFLLDNVAVPIQNNFKIIVSGFTKALLQRFGTKLLKPETVLSEEMEHYYNELERFLNLDEEGQRHYMPKIL
ncbi:MAG: hypothetical protein PHZ07_05230 [Patescibacteria group bacterium]|nr:hypothetical protein [Patescibacteria group bacterium]MDD4304837.1 hypothetical protein [Patescibacteria group bacterium]MDD4695801.1 hypothetical protein [Patescibacteria group bacterium]